MANRQSSGRQWRYSLAVITLRIAASLVFEGPSVLAAQATPRVRELRAAEQPIADRLLPGDDIVHISPDYDVAMPDHVLNAAETIADAASRADLVAIVDVNDVSAALVDNGSWIRTRLAGRVRQILKTSSRTRKHFSEGNRVELYVTGGELKIGKVIVRAAEVLRLPAHREYLLFMRDDGASLGLGPTLTPLMVDRGLLVDTFPIGVRNAATPLNGLALNAVAAQLKLRSQ
jgi:hypothetical protein